MYIGIDFGNKYIKLTSYCDETACCLWGRGECGIPIAFYYDAEKGEVVGEEAAAEGEYSPQNVVCITELQMGKTYVLDGKEFSYDEIVGKLFKEAIEYAENAGSVYVEDFQLDGVVISCPARFSEEEAIAFSKIVENCMGPHKKVNVVGLLRNPEAAAINCYKDRMDELNNGDRILVYDLGESTCDVSLLEVDKSKATGFDVIDSDSEKIGGRDWDKALYEYAKEKIRTLTNGQINVDGNLNYENDLYKGVVTAKHALSISPHACIRNFTIHHEALRRGIPITRREFIDVTENVFKKAVKPLVDMYNIYKDNTDTKIKDIVVVGSGSVANGIEGRDYFQKNFEGLNVRSCDSPENAVAIGNAIFADKIFNEKFFEKSKNVDKKAEKTTETIKEEKVEIILDKISSTSVDECSGNLPHSYGIKCRKNRNSDQFVVKNLLIKGHSIPLKYEYNLFKVSSDSRQLEFAIYKSDCTNDIYLCDGTENETLAGKFTFTVPTAIRKDEDLTTVITVDDSSSMTVKIQDSENNELIKITLPL